MKILILSLLSFFILSSSYAYNCEHKLLSANHSVDSSFFQIYIDLVNNNENEMMNEVVAMNSAQYVTDLVGCGMKLDFHNVDCQKPFRYAPMICYVEAKNVSGYFIINKDYVDNVNITFNRWD
jgi:hypothetical protein